jgi:importin subunit beta-1
MYQYVSGIVSFLQQCWMDKDNRTDTFSSSMLGLIGDFGDTYKGAVKEQLMQEWIQGAISWAKSRGRSKSAKNNALYAQQVSGSHRARRALH